MSQGAPVIEMAAGAVASQLKNCEAFLDNEQYVKFAEVLEKNIFVEMDVDEAIANEWFLDVREVMPGELYISVQTGLATSLVEDEKRPRRIFNWNFRSLFELARQAVAKREAAEGKAPASSAVH